MAEDESKRGRGFAGMSREKQQAIARQGGLASSGQFGRLNDPVEAGRKGAAAQPLEAKRRGGRNSHRGREDGE